jgi:hypothetical protein
MKLTKTFYYQYGSQYPSQINYESQVNPAFILDDYRASIYINIPFKVKNIHVKNITYVSGQASNEQGNAACQNYVTLTSSLVGGRPLGMVHRDSQFSMNTTSDIEHTFLIPAIINGYYDFTFYTNNGKPYKYIAGDNTSSYPFFDLAVLNPPFLTDYFYWFDYFSITMEFNGEDEIF